MEWEAAAPSHGTDDHVSEAGGGWNHNDTSKHDTGATNAVGGENENGTSREPGACFNCGQTGHNKADCTNPRVFTGTCRVCNEPGHMAADCPSKPAMVCKNCNKEGHKASECTNNRVGYLADVPDVTPEEAWKWLKAADAEKDLFQMVKVYAKAVEHTTFVQLENAFRVHDFNTFIIGIEVQEEEGKVHTMMNLQGKPNCKYLIQFSLRAHPKRKSTAPGWPSSTEENTARLADAGFMEDRGIPKCSNCNGRSSHQLGHTNKFCKEDKREVEHTKVKCINCGEEGHRVRDCKVARVDPNTCRNCGKPGHRSTDCEEPRSAAGVECKRCNEVGHFARDCPNSEPRDTSCRNCGEEGHMAKDCDRPRNNDNMICHNCDQLGHMSRECPEPRNWSKVTCSQCGEKGHTIRRCPQAAAEAGENGNGGGGDLLMPVPEEAPASAPRGNYQPESVPDGSGAVW
ncbi:MAG: hypothetical protein M1826_001327 [Phylliscum demangeonii]|nr:MAG: hypothetical protein M1826_001327 [Phylliscum demangeonii]